VSDDCFVLLAAALSVSAFPTSRDFALIGGAIVFILLLIVILLIIIAYR